MFAMFHINVLQIKGSISQNILRIKLRILISCEVPVLTYDAYAALHQPCTPQSGELPAMRVSPDWIVPFSPELAA
jgi:hypothetical protein